MLKALLAKMWRGSPARVRRLGVWLTQARFTVTAGAVVLDEGGRVLLLQHTFRRGSGWGIPGGFLAKGEQPEEALRRELREETGMELETARIAFVRTLKRPQQVEIIYRCRVRDADKGFRQNLEIKNLAWFARHELPEVTPDQRRIIERAFEVISDK